MDDDDIQNKYTLISANIDSLIQQQDLLNEKQQIETAETEDKEISRNIYSMINSNILLLKKEMF